MFGKVNKSDKDEFKIGDIVIYENHISKVIRIDLPKYKLLRIRIYHTWGVPGNQYTETTVSSELCEKIYEPEN